MSSTRPSPSSPPSPVAGRRASRAKRFPEEGGHWRDAGVPQCEHPFLGREIGRRGESILDGTLRVCATKLLGPGAKFMTDQKRTRQIGEMLARSPNPERVWVFGFGSLIWNPAFHFVERRTARVHGFHRKFCLAAKAGRGTSAASRCMNCSGDITRCVVPSGQAVLSVSTTCPA